MQEMSERRKPELLSISERFRGEIELAIHELGADAALQVATTALMVAAKAVHSIEPLAAQKIIANIVAEAGR